jgi:hypothetical protein
MRQGFRFNPPDLPAPPGVFWALQRAFGPLGTTVELIETPKERLQAASRLGLLPRISARQPETVLALELGDETAQKLTVRTRIQMAYGLAIEATQRQISSVAQVENIPIVLLKFAALYAKKKVTVASRAACDLDILVTPADVPRLTENLLRLGFTRLNLHSPAHQPVVLKSPSSVAIELHVHLPYVRTIEGGPFADLPSLQNACLLERYFPDNDVVFLPKDELLIAHLIAHGIAQHGFEPKTYPLLRMVSDLFDLGVAVTDRFELDVFPLVSTDVSRDEAEALRQLVASLREKDVCALWGLRTNDALLVRHFVLAVLNERYQARVLLKRTTQTFSETGIWPNIYHFVEFGLLLSNDQFDKIYPNKNESYFWLRVKRPFDFIRRGLSRIYRSIR